jgi:hypothetical protein
MIQNHWCITEEFWWLQCQFNLIWWSEKSAIAMNSYVIRILYCEVLEHAMTGANKRKLNELLQQG